MINYSAQSASVSYGCCSKPCLKTTEKLEHITLSEMSDRERQMPYDITYIWNLKNNTNELSMQNRNRLWKTNMVTKGERE